MSDRVSGEAAVAKWEGEVMGMRVAVLDDGERIVNADDLAGFFERLESGDVSEEQLEGLAMFCRGRGVPSGGDSR
jgi:hypothetical protein